MAEAYWDLEWELQQQGFDYCYDKRLYDRLEHDTVESVPLHLCADLAYQRKLVRFIENHDEPRALSFLPRRSAPPPRPLPRFREQNSFMKGSSREERSGFLSSSAAVLSSLYTLTSGLSTTRF